MEDKNDHLLALLRDPEFIQWVRHPTDESNSYWKNWLERYPGNKEDVHKIREFVERLRFREGTLSDKDTEMMLKNIISTKAYISPPRTSIFRFKPLKYAAMLVLALGASLVIWNLVNNKVQIDNIQPDISYIIKSNPKGQKSTFRMKDGTEVHLNSNSSLTYTSDFGISNRKVELKGEAYFSVATDPKRPFIVTSGDVLTTALGTEFNIDARTENKLRILLVEGKVKVVSKLKETTSFILLPNQSIEYDIKTGLAQVAEVDNLNEILWMQGILKFDHTPLVEVIGELENWYGVKINVLGDPEGLHYSGEFKKENLSNILKSMSFSLGLEYTLENEFIELKLNE